MLRQKARPYLFSNTLAPAMVGASLEAIDMIASSSELRRTLESNTKFFRESMQQVRRPRIGPLMQRRAMQQVHAVSVVKAGTGEQA